MTIQGFCSWCHELTNHQLYESSPISRNVYRCEGCRNLTLTCRACGHLAKGAPDPDVSRADIPFLKSLKVKWNDEFCAEHDGSISSFEGMHSILDDIEEYEVVFKRNTLNFTKGLSISALVVSGAVIFTPIGMAAAPSLASWLGSVGLLGAASTGTAISTLSGAALTSASLAAIGGGTMAKGVVFITAAGSALGGVKGALIANNYFGAVRNFSIRKFNEGVENGVICVNGFTTEDMTDLRDWKPTLRDHFEDHSWYLSTWESKRLADVGNMFLGDLSGQAAFAYAKRMARRAARKAGSKVNPLQWTAVAADVIGNPWHSAMVKASMTGLLLADLIARTKDTEFTLMGHSLGARVIYYALEALSTKDRKRVKDVYLFGGAVARDDVAGWRSAASAVSGTIYNCYSKRDMVLFYLYQGASAGLSSPIGIAPIEGEIDNVVNYDCTDLVGGHNEWKARGPAILEKLNRRTEERQENYRRAPQPRDSVTGRFIAQA
jgi:hypothetical protein